MEKLQIKITAIVLLFSLFFPVFSSAQTKAGLPDVEIPKTIDVVLEEGQEVGEQILQALPKAVMGLWNNRVIPVWKGMLDWAEEILWGKYFLPFFKGIWQQFTTFSEEKRPQLKEEFAKEKQEIEEGLKSGISKAGKGLWQRFLDLFRDDEDEN